MLFNEFNYLLSINKKNQEEFITKILLNLNYENN